MIMKTIFICMFIVNRNRGLIQIERVNFTFHKIIITKKIFIQPTFYELAKRIN